MSSGRSRSLPIPGMADPAMDEIIDADPVTQFLVHIQGVVIGADEILLAHRAALRERILLQGVLDDLHILSARGQQLTEGGSRHRTP